MLPAWMRLCTMTTGHAILWTTVQQQFRPERREGASELIIQRAEHPLQRGGSFLINFAAFSGKSAALLLAKSGIGWPAKYAFCRTSCTPTESLCAGF